MSSSKFRLIEDNADEPLTLFVHPDGTVTPDKETVKQILSNRASMDINLMTMKKVDAGEVSIIMDTLTYVDNDGTEDPSEMTELSRNLYNIRRDHDYTPFTSPSHVPSSIDMVDDLATTLSMLEDGSLDPQVTNEPLTKITKIVNGRKQTIFVNSKEKQRMINAGLLREKSTEKVFKKPKPLQTASTTSSPAPTVTQSPSKTESNTTKTEGTTKPMINQVKSTKKEINDERKVLDEQQKTNVSANNIVQDKKLLTPNKKDKKPKPNPPDEMALFSTPDIIRRVGKDAEKSPTSTAIITKPAKISPESRSKSNAEKKRLSTEERPPSARRVSLDSKNLASISTTQSTEIKDQEPKEEQVSVQEFSESTESITDDQLEPLPNAEDIRAMIHSEGAISSILTDADDQQDDATANMNIDASSLDLDQSILDNINTDLIPEDILYKVAQSLIDNNTELQNVIDKSLTDGNLDLESAANQLEQQANDTLGGLNVSADNELSSNQSLSNELQQPEVQTNAVGAGTQIVRPDGRIVVIPPIERPTTRSRNKKPAVSPAPPPKPVIKPLDDQHVSGEELDSSANEEEDDDDDEAESDDDPNKLWCICNQPHNNRFMICCDTCEEWYHGKCVNVTKAMGHTMEQQGKEWMCVYCKDPSLKRPAAAMRRMRKASRTSTESSASTVKSKQSNTSSKTSSSTAKRRSSTAKKDKDTPVKDGDREKTKVASAGTSEKKPGCVVCGKPSRNSSIYCSDQCILKHAQGVEKVAVVNKKPSPPTNSPNSKAPAKIVKPSGPLTQSKLKIVKNAGNQGVSLAVQKKGVNVGVLHHSPKTQSNSKPVILNSTLKTKSPVQGLKVVSKQTTLQLQRANDEQSKPKMATSTPQKLLNKTPAKVTTPPATKKDAVVPQKTPKARAAEASHQPKQENLRETVRKTFFEQLSNRLKDVDDLKLSDDELKAVSDEIESQLYRCFADTGQKYRNKYRSLIFNIKDPKNQTLWRRICEKSVNPYQLVRLSHDDLASQELALWRERETKHQLDMIKKSELELLNCSRQYVFKTHKGETVFEDERGKDAVGDVLANPVADAPVPEDEDEDKKSHRDKDRKSSREKDSKGRSKSKDRDRDKDRKKRSKSRDRDKSRHSDRDRERRRSRSRDRHRERERDRERRHKSSRHKKDEDKKEKTINTEKLDKRSKEILEQLVDKQIVPPLEDKLWKTEEVAPAQENVTAPAPILPESDSDHEPSSTVTIPTPPRVPEVEESAKKAETIDTEKTVEKDDGKKIPEEPKNQEPLWKGSINMVDVAHIAINAYEVTGDCQGLGDELPKSLDIVGRISPSTVWDYIGKMKTSNSKSISVLRLTAITMEERNAYLSLYSYLSSRQRLGVVKCVNKRVKDFYILPLASNSSIPDALLPMTRPGFEDGRPSLLVGVIVRDKRKRTADVAPVSHAKRVRVEIVTNRGGTPPPPSTSRSYTPPPSLPRADPRVKLPVPSVDAPEENEEDMDEPYSPADSDPDSMQEGNKELNTDLSGLLTGGAKGNSFLETGIPSIPANFEPFANKFDGIPGLDVVTPTLPSNSLEIEQKMAELDQKIAAQKAEIDKVSKDLVGSGGSSDLESASLANIALPSNLQQILESIKSIGNKGDTPEYQPETSSLTLGSGSSTDLTIPLLLPKLSSRTVASGSPASDSSPVSIPMSFTSPPPKLKPEDTKPTSGGVLSSMSEADLIKKAAEMMGEVDPPPLPSLKRNKSPPPGNASKKGRLEMNQPPIPGLED